MRRFVSLAVVTAAAAVVGFIAPPNAFATTHWTKKQAGNHYLQIVRPFNKELDVWFDVVHGAAPTLRALTREAGQVGSAENKYVQRLIKGNWPARDMSLAQKLEVRSLKELDGWEAVATAQTLTELQRAVRVKISSAGLATEFRKAIGLPPPS
jgi:hypothetical protein